MKKYINPLFIVFFITTSLTLTVGCKRELTPMEKMFSSGETVRINLIGTCFASEDNNCLIDFRRNTRYKVFVRNNSEWMQFNGKKYFITYSQDNSVCVECAYMEGGYGTDLNADGILTPKYFELKVEGSEKQKFENMRIVTNSEAESIYKGKQN